ncbi:MAG TPA: MaoC family dehydratase [Candidatus Baltobacteraceae bacterium]|nr:MaoC family dehydratase [Candidatus Baltobacteraceae bacterium]
MTTVGTLEELESLRGATLETDWREIDQERIDRFASVTEDHQWIHVDRERAAAESPYGTTIAHGFLTLSLLSAMFKQCCAVRASATINYGFDRIRFISPVRSGARIRGRFTLGAVDRNADGSALAVWSVEVALEDSPKPALAATWLVRVYFS